MRQKRQSKPGSAEQTVRDIRRATRRQYSAEEKIRIVLEGLRGEQSITELYHKEGINQNLYYRWSKEFLEAGKKRLAGDTAREATSEEVKSLMAESSQLKEMLAEQMMENRLLKKTCSGMGRTLHEVCRRREARNHPTGRAVFTAGTAYPGTDW
jgi:transposase